LTNALENMKNKGLKFSVGAVSEWLDCGNKDATVYTNQRILELNKGTENLVSQKISSSNSVIIEPCYIGAEVKLVNSVIGPHVSLGSGTLVENSVIANSLVLENSRISNAIIAGSMIGNQATYSGKISNLSMGDFSIHQ
jgi:glucose-1-phosphate thymidylyltransferase